MELNGSDFGPADPVNNLVTATYNSSASGRALLFSAVNCTVQVAHTTVWCWAVAGVGAAFAWTLKVALYTGVSSLQHGLLLSYAGPNITSLSGALPMQTQGGELVRVAGTNFGPPGTPVTVWYGSAAGGNAYRPTCNVSDHTLVQCTTEPGVGAGLVWNLTVGGQWAVAAQSPTAYVPPTVTSVVLASPTST